MKLTSLNSSKFEAFKIDILNNPVAIVGGLRYHTENWQVSSSGTTAPKKDLWFTGADMRMTLEAGGETQTHWDQSGDFWGAPIGPGGNSNDGLNQTMLGNDIQVKDSFRIGSNGSITVLERTLSDMELF